MNLPLINEDVSLFELLAIIVSAFIAIAAIKVAISFDLNRWIERRDKQKKEKIALLCPHTTVEFVGNSAQIKSLMMSPAGTTRYICERCGITTYGSDIPESLVREYTNDVKELIRREKKFQRYVKRHYRL